MNNLTPDQQTMLACWQKHTYAEFVIKDPDAALATMTENPYVFLIPSATGGVGRAGVYEFYANQFLPNIPPDFELNSLSQTRDSPGSYRNRSARANAARSRSLNNDQSVSGASLGRGQSSMSAKDRIAPV